MSNDRRIVLGVTASVSVALTDGLAAFMAEQGWDVHLVSAPGAELDRVAGRKDVTVHEIEMRRDPAPIADLKALAAWIRLLRRLRPDAVMVGTPKAGLLGTLSAALVRVPVRIYLLRGLRLETSKGVSRSLFAALEWLTLLAATSSVAVSESLRQRLISMRLASASDVVVLGRGSSNGVDTERFDRGAELESDDGTRTPSVDLVPGVPVIGFVGRLHRDKGVYELAAASQELRRRGVLHQLLVVGATEDERARTALLSLRGVAEAVCLVGAVDDTAPFYQLMDVFCLPTWREGFPNVALEAAASSLPVVTTNATGAVDSVIPGVTGLIANVGDAHSLADALQAVLADDIMSAKMGQAGRHYVVTSFQRDDVWSRMTGYISSLVDGARTPASNDYARIDDRQIVERGQDD